MVLNYEVCQIEMKTGKPCGRKKYKDKKKCILHLQNKSDEEAEIYKILFLKEFEKAAAIGAGAVALGLTVHLGVTPPIIGSPAVVSLLTQKSEELFGGKFIVEVDPVKAAQLLLEHIKEKRGKLGLVT
jgi:hypothetical protein